MAEKNYLEKNKQETRVSPLTISKCSRGIFISNLYLLASNELVILAGLDLNGTESGNIKINN